MFTFVDVILLVFFIKTICLLNVSIIMKKILLSLIILFISKFTYADWFDLNTGINDNLTGVVFWGNNGLVSGNHGLYFTTTGGMGAASWTRFNINNNYNDSVLYNRTKFKHAFADPVNGINKAIVCGVDTVDNKSVIISINLSSFTYSVAYTGPINSGGFNKISFYDYDNCYYIAGDNGQLVKMNNTSGAVSLIPTPYSFDFYSISYSGISFCIGGQGNFITGINNSGVFTFNNSPYPLNNFKDVCYKTSGVYFGVGDKYFAALSAPLKQINNYDFGPLNADCIFYNNINNSLYVGTDHGIFKSTPSCDVLEWQPSSLQNKIKSIWHSNSSSTPLYACGDNGVLLRATTASYDNGGYPKPYASINIPGGCLNKPVTIWGITGSSTYCNWYIDNVPFSTSCNSAISHVFTSVGQHTIQVNVSSYGGGDTAIQVINIVDPEINKNLTLSKSILCKQEQIVLTIDSSEQNIYYKLKKFGSSLDYGTSSIGNTSALSFTSSVLSDGGNYYLQANSTIASCSKNFTDTIKIQVEKTTADFHVATINANPNEIINCFENTTDAQNFNWIFSPGGSSTNLSSPTPSVSFPTIGTTQIKLIAWSNNGCYDTIQKKGPTIYNEPVALDSCWTIQNNGIDISLTSLYSKDIAQLSPSKTGFITCGFYYNEAFASNYGDSLRFPNSQGGCYLAKYNQNGALKWINHSVQTQFLYPIPPQIITSAVEDKNGNIYACGTGEKFIDNSGDVFFPSFTNFLIKLDSTGKVIWRIESSNSKLSGKLYIDNIGDIYLVGQINNGGTYVFNGVTTFTFNANQWPANYAILKFSPSGSLLWGNSMSNSSFGIGEEEVTLTFDKSNCFYLTSNLIGSTNVFLTPDSNTYQTVNGIFLLKYNSSGGLLWKMSSNSGRAYSSSTDSVGNIYVSGGGNSAPSFTVGNADGTITSAGAGSYFVAKVDASGICKWIQRNSDSSTYYGVGYGVYQDVNEVSVLGQLRRFSGLSLTTKLTSADNLNINLTIADSDYFIAIYDTLGNIKRVIKNGSNPFGSNEEGFKGFYKLKNRTYRFGRNYQYGYPYLNFGDIVPKTNAIDGSIITCSENCGIVLTHSTISCVNPTVSVNSPTVCYGSTATLTASGASSYTWIPNPTLGSTMGATVTANTLSNGFYSVVGGTGACMTITNTVVYVVPTPTLSVESHSVCIGTGTILHAMGVSTYTWYPSGSNGPDLPVFPTSTTDYTVMGNRDFCSNTYSAIATVSVELNVPTIILTSTSPSVCAGKTATLSASGSSSGYMWAYGPYSCSGSTLIVTPTPTLNTYTVAGYSPQGCVGQATMNISIVPIPTINISGSGFIICAGESVTLTATGADTYTWTNGVANGIGFTPTVTKTYTVMGSVSTCTTWAQTTVYIDPCAGIQENSNQSEFSIYPNPTKDIVYINGLDDNIEIKLINSLGQNLNDRYSNGVVNLAGLNRGMYFLLIFKDNQLYFQQKVIKE